MTATTRTSIFNSSTLETSQHFNISTFQLFNIFNISTCWGFQHPMLCKFVQMLTMLSTIHFFSMLNVALRSEKLQMLSTLKCWPFHDVEMLKCCVSTFNIQHFNIQIHHSTFNIQHFPLLYKIKVVDWYPRRVAVRRRSVGRRRADGMAIID